jgi:hypothetical protein
MKLSKSQQQALQQLAAIEAALLAGCNWGSVRTAAIALASLADNRAIREGGRH